MSQPLSVDGRRLVHNLQQAHSFKPADGGKTFHVSGIATTLYFAYEQLRNATQYTERHLLLRAAIERFLRRSVQLRAHGSGVKLGDDLVSDLTQAGYLSNDSIPLSTLDDIDAFIASYAGLYRTLNTERHIPHDMASAWVYQVLSMTIERLLVPQPLTDAFVDFAYHHYQSVLARDQPLPVALHCGLHRALLKSDVATTRAYWLARVCHEKIDADGFITACRQIDEHFSSPASNKLVRLLNRYGAPMRALRELIMCEGQAAIETVQEPDKLAARLREITEKQYASARQKVIKGIVGATIFVFITKILIGLAIEIPYDLAVYSQIELLPLLVNLIFPTAYLASAYFSVRPPSGTNTKAVADFAQRILYTSDDPPDYKLKSHTPNQLRAWFNIIYILTYAASFGLIIWILYGLRFDWLHMVIFFIFFSAVSFLRYRLIQANRELELVQRPPSLLGIISDFFYTPFIRLGYWLTDKYRRLSIMSFILDLAIELPLKALLRILREWVGFIREKRDDI